ncbi:nucleotide exchange factor GrpE [Hellea balneolensis]|uniref:nucleotide exchange factor GrpE n=1 Tax=Hellea balneolensis TaxID=287478 RepID=UPI000418A58E|nr:nucleotide exchange factor GrpE [Hellea balneolensis]
MAGKKNKDIDMKHMDLGEDGLPSEEDLDALQRAIDMEMDGMAQREAAAEASEADDDSDAKRIEELEAELAALKDKALRAMADADNVKKRAEREVAAAKTYGIERFAVDMLSVHDNLSRALLNLDGKAKEDMGQNAKNLLEGIELTEKDLILTLSRHGVKAVPGVGSKFDPNVHQAVAQIPSDEDKGNVATVMQTGFKLGERTLRAAMVAVSTGPAKS